MNANKRPQLRRSADIVNLADLQYGDQQTHTSPADQYAKRIKLVQSAIAARLTAEHDPAVAIAAAYITGAGTIGSIASGVEPEMAATLSHELRTLTSTLDRHSHARSHVRRRQRGSATALLITALGFIAATYINDVAWIDAALTLAAQIVAAFLSSRRTR